MVQEEHGDTGSIHPEQKCSVGAVLSVNDSAYLTLSSFIRLNRSSCSEQGLNRILAEFQRAARLLEETDMTFVDMCNSRAETASYSQFSNTAVEMPIRVAKHRNKKNMNRFRHRMQ